MRELDIVDLQVLKLIDYLIDLHTKTQTNLEFTSDYAFGYRFYVSNKYVVEQMRQGKAEGKKGKRAPHLLIINLANYFNVDYNYFYDKDFDVHEAIRSSDRQHNAIATNAQSSSKEYDSLRNELEKHLEENKNLMKENLQLNQDIAQCNKMAFEAQKGQTEALKELLAIKTKN
ncbi:hypothetical protein [Aquimarina aggregata]|uniref:hypothetical protein n=1 Tax=Aquimarina aggregata TaxID=1642818 RepID=UPI00248FE30E|nr:hypothetical protein [Aquimarina aggregata]